MYCGLFACDICGFDVVSIATYHAETNEMGAKGRLYTHHIDIVLSFVSFKNTLSCRYVTGAYRVCGAGMCTGACLRVTYVALMSFL